MQHSAYLGKYITDQLSKPTVLKGTLEKWPSRKWTPDHLASIWKQKVKIRIGPISAQSLKCEFKFPNFIYTSRKIGAWR